VLHLITRLELGGAQQNTLYCTAHHDREHFEVELIAGRGGLLDSEARRIPNARVQLVPYLEHRIAPLRDLLALLRLRRYFRQRRIDLVHTHSSKAGIVGRLAAYLAGVPVVVHTVHGWSFNDTQPAWRRRLYVTLEQLAGAVSDRLIVVAAKHRERGLGLGIGRPRLYTVVRSGIDGEQYRSPSTPPAEVRRELGFDAQHQVVGTLTCLKPQKAPLDFVDAASAAYAENDRLRFFIAGDGELKPRVTARIEEHGLQEVIKPLGWRTDVVDLLHATDVFLLTSHFEGLPRTVLQAMAAGVPVVATAVDGTPEVVEHGETGLLVPPSNPRAAAAAILRMVGDRALRERCATAARGRLTSAFDIRQMVRNLDALYLSLLSG
jgi:glycosyltransferase involved in cell wall biosynthesis